MSENRESKPITYLDMDEGEMRATYDIQIGMMQESRRARNYLDAMSHLGYARALRDALEGKYSLNCPQCGVRIRHICQPRIRER